MSQILDSSLQVYIKYVICSDMIVSFQHMTSKKKSKYDFNH